ncbi:MAG: hypothetical protein E7161_00805 [Firmicutes bacterium]|nr:hypothetical protein [Bacillota bacterium]
MKKGLILSIICLLTLCGCGKIPTLQNGDEAVITFAKDEKEHKISAEELYKELKNNFGLEATIKLVDTYVLENEFADYREEATKSAANYIEAMIESYGDETTLLQAIQYSTNYSSIEAYQEYLYLSFMQSHAIEEYAKGEVTDKEIETYYKDEAKEDVEVYHILITPEVKDSMTTEEKTKAEEKAKQKAEDVIKKLDDAKDKLAEFKKLVKEYSEDESTIKKDGNLGYINYGDLDENYDELLDAVYKLKDGKYSKNVITTELGYHVVYRNASKEKESLEDLKDEIIETLANRKMEEDTEISINSMKHYRKLYNMEIVDSELNRQYGIYLNNLINQANATDK